MKALKKVLPIALALGTALVGTTAHAKSISGSVDFRVTLPEVLVLYHWDDAHLTLTDVATTADNDSDAREISDATTRQKNDASIAESSHTITGDVTTTDNSKLSGGKIEVILKNAWGVRSLYGGTVKLRVKEQNPKLVSTEEKRLAPGTSPASAQSFITVSDTKIVRDGAEVEKEVDMQIPSGWEPVKGDIKFNIDLTQAKHTGEYNTRGTVGQARTDTEGQDVFLLTLQGS